MGSLGVGLAVAFRSNPDKLQGQILYMFTNMKMNLFTWALTFLLIHHVYGWDSEELELFDLVEEINEDFYQVLGVLKVEINLLQLKVFYLEISKCGISHRTLIRSNART